MNARLMAITQRRVALVSQAAVQRAELGQCIQPWRTPLAYLDGAVALVSRARTHPLALVIGVLLLFRLGYGHWSLWAGRIWAGWQIYQSLQDRRSRRRD